jgi:hypothetical protein
VTIVDQEVYPMPEPMPLEERVRKASAARSAAARLRRHRKVVAEMRADGRVVHVMIHADGGYREDPDFTVEAVEASMSR